MEESAELNYVTEDGDIFILGDFDDSILYNVVPYMVKMIDKMSMLNTKQEINIYIDSRGGYEHCLQTMLAILQMAKNTGIIINTYNLCRAYSCGSILAVIGDNRFMYKYAENLMHYGCTVSETRTPLQLERETERNKRFFSNICEIYAQHSNMTKEEIDKLMSDDSCFLSAEQCLEKGLCDEIIG